MPSKPSDIAPAATVRVRIPSLLTSYTAGAREATLALDAPAPRLDDLLRALDRQFPGVRFRLIDEQEQVRPHIKLFVDGMLCRDLAKPLGSAQELMIVGALSGG